MWSPDHQQHQPYLAACWKCRLSGSIPNLFIRVCILATSLSGLYTYESLRGTGPREYAWQAESCKTNSGGCGQRKEWGWDWLLGLPTALSHTPEQREGEISPGIPAKAGGGAISQESFGNRIDTFRGCPPFRIMLSIIVAASHISLFKFKVMQIKLKFSFLSFSRQILGAQ